MKKKILYRTMTLLICGSLLVSMAGCKNNTSLSDDNSSNLKGSDTYEFDFNDENNPSDSEGADLTNNSGGKNNSSGNKVTGSNGGSTSSKPVIKDMNGRTFTFCAPSWDPIKTDESYVKQLEKTYNCKFKNLQLADYTTLYSSILSGNPIADVILLPESKFYVYAQKKLLYSLSDISTLNVNDNNIYLTAQNNNFTINGKVYGLARDNYALQRVLVYNRSIVKGSDDLQTLANNGQLSWDKIREILKKAVGSGVSGIAGMMQESDVLGTLIHANGGRVFSRDNLKFTYTLESQNTRNAISFAQNLYSSGLIMSNNGGNYLYPQSQFSKGKVAMMIANSWNLNYIFDHAKFDIGLVLMPGGPDVNGPLIEQTEFSSYSIPATANSPEDIGIIFTAWAIEADKNGDSKNHFITYWDDIIGDSNNMSVIKEYVAQVEKGNVCVDYENAITNLYDDGLYGLENKVLYGDISAQSYLESVGNVYMSKAADFK